MSILLTIYVAVLFFLLTPAILVRLPPSGSKRIVAAVHAIIFALIFHFTYVFVKRVDSLCEGIGEQYTDTEFKYKPSLGSSSIYGEVDIADYNRQYALFEEQQAALNKKKQENKANSASDKAAANKKDRESRGIQKNPRKKQNK